MTTKKCDKYGELLMFNIGFFDGVNERIANTGEVGMEFVE